MKGANIAITSDRVIIIERDEDSFGISYGGHPRTGRIRVRNDSIAQEFGEVGSGEKLMPGPCDHRKRNQISGNLHRERYRLFCWALQTPNNL